MCTTDDSKHDKKFMKYVTKYNTIKIMQHITEYDSVDEQFCEQIERGYSKKIKILYKIRELMKKKGFVFWLDEDCNIIIKELDRKHARNKLLKKIKNDIDGWKNKIVTEITLEIDVDKIMDNTSGGIELTCEVNKILHDKNKITIDRRENTHSSLTVCYKQNELKKYRISDIKKIANMMINKKMGKVCSHKYYYFKDIKDYIA